MTNNLGSISDWTNPKLLLTTEQFGSDTASEHQLSQSREEMIGSLSARLLRRNDRTESHTRHRSVSFPEEPTNLVGMNREHPPVFPVVLPPNVEPEAEFFVTLQRWEGYVVEINDDTFAAKLTDRTARGPREDAEFSIRELSNDDLPLLRIGATFYWSIGYHTDARGRRWTVSDIRFRRLPPLTEGEFNHAHNDAKALVSKLGYE